MVFPWMANCTFISPMTRSSRASAVAWSFIRSTSSGESEWGGSVAEASPEWMPASSMCSRTPPTSTSPVRSATRSRSTSMASFRKRSMSTGCSGDAFTASRMYRSRLSES